MKKATALVVIAILVLTGISGCHRYDVNNADDHAAEAAKMMRYINERYEDDTFTYRERCDRYAGPLSGYTPGILVYSEKYPDAYILVRHTFGSFSDNYLHYKYQKQEFAYLRNVLDEVLSYDYKLYIDVDNVRDSSYLIGKTKISADASFEEYMSYSSKYLSFKAVVAPGYKIKDNIDLPEMLKNALTSYGITVTYARIFFCMDQDVYESLAQGMGESKEGSEYSRLHVNEFEPFIDIGENHSDGGLRANWFFKSGVITQNIAELPLDDMGELIEFSYSFGSFHGGEWEYRIFEENGKLYLEARGYNGVDLDVYGEVPSNTLDEIAGIIEEYNICRWNGFNKSDHEILDGYSFRIYGAYEKAWLAAHGYMKYPSDYEAGHEALSAYLDNLANNVSPIKTDD